MEVMLRQLEPKEAEALSRLGRGNLDWAVVLQWIRQSRDQAVLLSLEIPGNAAVGGYAKALYDLIDLIKKAAPETEVSGTPQ